MHDAARAYETLVVDDPDAPTPLASLPQPSLGRVSTEDLVAQVYVEGAWHRRTPDLKETACGLEVQSQHSPPRREVLTLREGDMCSSCFTPHELLRALQNDANAIDAEDEAQRKRDAAAEARKRLKRPTPQGDR